MKLPGSENLKENRMVEVEDFAKATWFSFCIGLERLMVFYTKSLFHGRKKMYSQYPHPHIYLFDLLLILLHHSVI